MTKRLAYLRRMALDRIWRRNLACPNCGSGGSSLVDQKYLITELRRCSNCRLMFRAPTDSVAHNDSFYNDDYEQGFTTDMPDASELEALKARKFAGSLKDYSFYLAILHKLGLRAGVRLFDFGCSWGYGTWQFQQAGFDVWAAEVSRPRRNYAAQKLEVRIVEDVAALAAQPDFAATFECFFSAHVLEHVPQPSEVFDLAARLLKPGGLFVSLTPNGSAEHRAASPAWSKLWGAVHPNFIDSEFLDRSFAGAPRFATSTRQDLQWLEKLQLTPASPERWELASSELLFVARRPSSGSWQGRLAA